MLDERVEKIKDLPMIGFSLATGIITAADFGTMALVERHDLESKNGCAPNYCEDEVLSLDNHGWIADVGLGAAMAGTITGTMLMILDNGLGQESTVSIDDRFSSVKREARVGVRF